MNNEKKFSERIKEREFVITAEYLPKAGTEVQDIKASVSTLKSLQCAVNVSDNPFGVSMSSLAASVHLTQNGVEPIYQVVTRDRNRIAIQSDILGAASLGIRNILCLSGYHQVLTDNPESANVYDIDSTQLIAMVKQMNENGELLNGVKISGSFSMTAGAVANPYMTPLELNILRLTQKVNAGAEFIQTHAVFDTDGFARWLDAAKNDGVTDRAVILAGILPLESAEEAEKLAEKFTDFRIPSSVIERLKAAGDKGGQKKEGIAICAEIIKKIKDLKGLGGIHILSGGKEELIPEILSAAGIK